MTFNLKSLAIADDGHVQVMQVRHPITGEPLVADGEPLTISLAGRDSDILRAARREALDTRVKKSAAGKLTAEDIDAESLATLARCTVGWSKNLAFSDDKDAPPLEFSFETALSLYKKLPWLREQAEDFASNRANFMKG